MSSSKYKIKSPADGSILGEVGYFEEKDIPIIVEKARKAFKSWRFSAPHERARILKDASVPLVE